MDERPAEAPSGLIRLGHPDIPIPSRETACTEEADVTLSPQSLNIPKFAWEVDVGKTEAEILLIKEDAVEKAKLYAQKISHALQDAVGTTEAPKQTNDADIAGAQNLREWVKSVETVMGRQSSLEILVGVAGITGAGKSSLLNSLLGVQELLPSGQQEAATAVPCKVSWNHDHRPGYECRAEIYFLTMEEALAILVRTFHAIKDLECIKNMTYDNEEQRISDQADTEYLVREGVNRIRSVWGMEEAYLKDLVSQCHDVESFGTVARKITDENPDVEKLLMSKSKVIYEVDTESLSKKIKPYLDSTAARHGKGEEFAAWPLIKKVNLFLRQDILKTGISLVDLPGVGDAVESRSKISETYISSLAVTIIVSPIHRAADERFTQSLMGDYQEIQMQMNGIYNRKQFGVVLSKIDDIDADTYVRRDREARSSPIVQKNSQIISSETARLRQRKKDKSNLEKMVQRLRAKVKRAEERVHRLDREYLLHQAARSYLNPAKKGRRNRLASYDLDKAKRVETQERHNFRAAKKQLKTAGEEEKASKEQIKLAQDRLIHWAITTRNTYVQNRMYSSFERHHQNVVRTDGSLAGAEPCGAEVMPTSTFAFWKLVNKKPPLDGFPKPVYTGVPHVEKWLHKATAQRRTQHLDGILASYQVCFSLMHTWCRAQVGGVQSGLTPEAVEGALAPIHEKYRLQLNGLFDKLRGEIKKLDPLEAPGPLRHRFEEEAAYIVARWAFKSPDQNSSLKLAWNTYKAIAAKHGGPFTSNGQPRTTYDWNATLVTVILRGMVHNWNQKINIELPMLDREVSRQLGRFWGPYINDLKQVAVGLDSTLEAQFEKMTLHLLQLQAEVKSRIKTTLENFRKSAAGVHAGMKETLELMLERVYDEAASFNGNGAHEDRKELLQRRIPELAPKIFDRIWSTMRKDLDTKKEEVDWHLDSISLEATRYVKMQVSMILNNVLACNGVGSREKETLQKTIQAHLAKWQAAWQFPAEDSGHVLMQDVSIPKKLHAEDLRITQGSDTDIDTDVAMSDVDSSDGDKDDALEVKNEPV